jgi:hypothetical protein
LNLRGLWWDFIPDDDVAKHVFADLHHSVEFGWRRRLALEVHHYIDAFSAPLDLVRKPSSIPLVDLYDLTAVVEDNLPILVYNRLELFVIQ